MNIQSLINDLASDLITTNEIGDGTRDYRWEGETLYLDIYEENRTDAQGFPIPDTTYRIEFTMVEEES